MIKAIETRYAGCKFRSRLEARWAVFFTTLGIGWEHEPEGFETSAGRYLPDFRLNIPGSGPGIWFEVKPPSSIPDARHAAFAEYHTLIVARGMPNDYQDQLASHRSALMVWGGIHIGWHTCAWGTLDVAIPAAFVGKDGFRSIARDDWSMLKESVRWHGGGMFTYEAHVAIQNRDEDGRDHGGYAPMFSADVDKAYAAARSERFGT